MLVNMNDILLPAKEGNYGVGFFNAINVEMARAVIETAEEFVKRTGADALAVAVGNAHGDYAFPPKLDFDRIDTISKKTNIPLVLHGGSGLADDDFRRAVKLGISKVNIFTDIDKAGKAGVEAGIAAGEKTMMGLIPYEISAMKKVVAEKIRLFGSEGKV